MTDCEAFSLNWTFCCPYAFSGHASHTDTHSPVSFAVTAPQAGTVPGPGLGVSVTLWLQVTETSVK